MTLKEQCEALRSATDYHLPTKTYTIIMVDGHSFSKLIKNRYKKPLDEDFVNAMNECAKLVCEKVQGCKFAYIQSDEISFVLTDFDTPETTAFFGNRLCKLQSIIPSIATAKFNQMSALRELNAAMNILLEGKRIIGVRSAEFTLAEKPTVDDRTLCS